METILGVILQNIGMLILIAILTEALTEAAKTIVPIKIEDKITYIVALILGITLAFALDVNLFGLTGYWTIFSKVCAGMISSRGANFVNGFVKKLELAKSL